MRRAPACNRTAARMLRPVLIRRGLRPLAGGGTGRQRDRPMEAQDTEASLATKVNRAPGSRAAAPRRRPGRHLACLRGMRPAEAADTRPAQPADTSPAIRVATGMPPETPADIPPGEPAGTRPERPVGTRPETPAGTRPETPAALAAGRTL